MVLREQRLSERATSVVSVALGATTQSCDAILRHSCMMTFEGERNPISTEYSSTHIAESSGAVHTVESTKSITRVLENRFRAFGNWHFPLSFNEDLVGLSTLEQDSLLTN